MGIGIVGISDSLGGSYRNGSQVRYREEPELRRGSGGNRNSSVKTQAKLQALKDPCPYCHYPILKKENAKMTPGGMAHAICPTEMFLRKFKGVGLIRKEAKRVEFHRIPLVLRLLFKVFVFNLGISIFSGKEITERKAREIDEKMGAFIWASRMFLKQEESATVQGESTESCGMAANS